MAAGGAARGDAAAGPDAAASSGFGGGLQCALWLPPRDDQCRLWHFSLQYHVRRHRAHCMLTSFLPVRLQEALAQRNSPAAVAFFPLPIMFAVRC